MQPVFLASVVLCLSAVTQGTEEPGEKSAPEDDARQRKCFLEAGLPPQGPETPWEAVPDTWADREKWLAKNRASDYNGELCDPLYAMPHCRLLSKDFLSWLVQAVLVMIGVGSLVLKKYREDAAARRAGRPMRTTKVWALDVSKQAFSGACAHLIGMFNANTLQSQVEDHVGTSECSWYLIAFTLDTTFGVLVGYLLIRLCAYVGEKFPCVSALKETGNYQTDERDIDYSIWGKQLFVWCIITVVARMGVLGIMLWAKHPLTAVAAVVAQEFACRPRTLLWLVMLAGPVTMNIIQLWVQDQFLKDKQLEFDGALNDPNVARASYAAASNPAAGINAPLLGAQVPRHADADTAEAGSPTDPYADVRTAKEVRRHCCGWVLKLLASMFILVPLLMFTGVLASEQYYYDHCYTQVQTAAFNVTPYQTDTPYTAADWQPVPKCKLENTSTSSSTERDKTTLRWQTEHRWDLIEAAHRTTQDGKLQLAYKPKCRCCNQQQVMKLPDGTPSINPTTGEYEEEAYCTPNRPNNPDGINCPHMGQCCGRSTVTDPDPALQQACSVCDTYLPCDTGRCAARPDFIRNAQHYPLALGVILSLLSNLYIVYTWIFNSKLRRPTVTSLICLAAAIELVYCAALLLQEISFRVPNEPCEPETQASAGQLDVIFNECDPISQLYGWPSWAAVQRANDHEQEYRNLYRDKPDAKRQYPGQRGDAVNYCQPMSFLFQLTWTASDSVYFMITVDLFLNLFSSPFGGTSKRWIFYHLWTWSISLLFAVLLMYSDDWGVSQESVLEDFCWNVNFGHHTLYEKHGSLDPVPKSNWPGLQIAVYTVSGSYYALSLGMAAYAQCKIRRGNLPEGLKEARLESIKIGTVVTSLCALWLLMVGVLYFIVMSMIEESNMTKLDTLMRGLRDYPPHEETKELVMVWAFVWGARNVINLIVWRYVIAQYSPHHAEITFVPGMASMTLRKPPARVRQTIERIIEAEILQAPRASMAQSLQNTAAVEKKRRDLERMSRDRPAEFSALAEQLGVQDAGNLELNDVLRNELLFFAGLGIRSALRYPYHEHDTRSTIGSRRSNRRSEWNSRHEETRDTGYDNAVPISLAKAQAWEKHGGDNQGPTDFSREVEEVFTATTTRTSQHFSTGVEEPLTESERERQEARNEERLQHLQKFQFKTYQPKKFRRLREMFGIDIRGDEGQDSELHKSMESFEVANFTGGASGAFMYFSADKRFIIKQINKNEVNRMLKMLDGYIQHLEDSRDGDGPPHSLLQRVVQCNRITMSEHDKCCGIRPGRLYFMVMENCFYPRIIRQIAILHKEENPGQPLLSDEATEQLPLKEKAPLLKKLELNDYTNQCFFVYDLKGSRHGRSALMDNGTREQQMRSTMKDNDLRENVHLSADDRKVVLDFLEKDSQFLADQQVMDYSLLLGIQKGVQPVPARTFSNSAAPVAAANKFQQFAPAAALDGAEIFYFGIIDFLQVSAVCSLSLTSFCRSTMLVPYTRPQSFHSGKHVLTQLNVALRNGISGKRQRRRLRLWSTVGMTSQP